MRMRLAEDTVSHQSRCFNSDHQKMFSVSSGLTVRRVPVHLHDSPGAAGFKLNTVTFLICACMFNIDILG